jgi:hypothetical protein
MSLHTTLFTYADSALGERLAAPPQLAQDAITLVLRNGVVLTVRYAAADAYSLRWLTTMGADALELGIDTAPSHPQLATVPNHLHLASGAVVADPLTHPNAAPEENLLRVIDALLLDPQLSQCAAPGETRGPGTET